MKVDFTSDINKDYAVPMNYPEADRLIVLVHWGMLAALAVLTFLNSVVQIANFYPSPFSWRVISLPEAAATIILGLLAAILPALFRGKIKDHYAYRILTTFTLAVFSYLFVFVSGGAIEMHFMFFVVIALSVIYSDWRLGWIMLVLVALHHGILNYTAPGWVYFYGRNDFSFIAHALPVVLEVIFTTMLCVNQRKAVITLVDAKVGLEKTIALRTADLRKAKEKLEALLKAQNTDLEEVKRLNNVLVDRELRMVELKKEIEDLRAKS